MLLDDDELIKKLKWMEKEYGPEWRDVIGDQLRTNQFGPNLPRGLGLLESRGQAEQMLGHELVPNTGPQLQPSFKDMMDTSGPRFVQDPYQNAQMNPMHSKYAGSKIPFPSQGNNELRGQINALYSQMDPNRELAPQGGSPHEGWYSGTPMAFDDPSIAGTPITDHPRFNSYAGNLEPSPLQMRAMQEQIGGPGFHSPPRFASANEPMMDDKIRYSDRSDPNFNAPMSFHGGSPSGLLSSEVTPTNKGGKWEKTPEGNDSIYRRNRRLQGYKGIMDLGARITGGPTRWR